MNPDSSTFTNYDLFSPKTKTGGFSTSRPMGHAEHLQPSTSQASTCLGLFTSKVKNQAKSVKDSVTIDVDAVWPNDSTAENQKTNKNRKEVCNRQAHGQASHKKVLLFLLSTKNLIYSAIIVTALFTASFVNQWFFDPTRIQNVYLTSNFLSPDFSTVLSEFKQEERIVVEVHVKHFTDAYRLSDISYTHEQLTQAIQHVINLFALANVYLAVPLSDITDSIPMSLQHADVYRWYISGFKLKRKEAEKYNADVDSMLTNSPGRIPPKVVDVLLKTNLKDPVIMSKMFGLSNNSAAKVVFPSLHLVYYALRKATQVGATTVLRAGSCKPQFSKKLHDKTVECQGWNLVHEPNTLDVDALARAMAHEFGHIFGLRHRDIECKNAPAGAEVPLMMADKILGSEKCSALIPSHDFSKQLSVQEFERIRDAAQEFKMRQRSAYRLQGRGPLGIDDILH